MRLPNYVRVPEIVKGSAYVGRRRVSREEYRAQIDRTALRPTTIARARGLIDRATSAYCVRDGRIVEVER